MIAPAWCLPFTRFEYADRGRGPAAFDCWGFVRHVQSERFGIVDLPDLGGAYGSSEDHGAVANVVRRYERVLAPAWRKVEDPRPGDVVIIKIAQQPWHCGVVVASRLMMHMLKGVNVGIERFDREPWRNRIEGFYRHV